MGATGEPVTKAADPPPKALRTWRPMAAWTAGILLALGLVGWFVVRPAVGRGLGLHYLLTTAERYREFSEMSLPGSAEVIIEEYEKRVFLDPQYRIVFRVSERDARGLLAGKPPRAQGAWSRGTRVRPFAKPVVAGGEDSWSISGEHGTRVFQGFNVDLRNREVEFVYSEM